MSEHILEVSRDDDYLKRLAQHKELDDQDHRDAFHVTIRCPNPASCNGWEECSEAHEVDGVSAVDGPYETPCMCAEAEGYRCSVPWCGADGFDFHGVTHEWRWGYGWTKAYDGCVVTSCIGDLEVPDGIDTTRDATYLVDDEWNDTECYLSLICEVVPDA